MRVSNKQRDVQEKPKWPWSDKSEHFFIVMRVKIDQTPAHWKSAILSTEQSILWKIPDSANVWKISIRHKKSNKESAKLTKSDIE